MDKHTHIMKVCTQKVRGTNSRTAATITTWSCLKITHKTSVGIQATTDYIIPSIRLTFTSLTSVGIVVEPGRSVSAHRARVT